MKELLDAGESLAGAMVVFDEGEADKAFAEGAEADTGGNGDEGFFEELLGEFEGAKGTEALGDGGPEEHAAFWFFDRPTGTIEALDEEVATLLVQVADLVSFILALAQGDDGGDLDGLEVTVIEIALDASEGLDHAGVAENEADAPAGHVVAFGHGEDLDGVLLGAIDLENAGGLAAVETEIGVGEIVNDHGAVLGGEVEQLAEEIELDGVGSGVMGEADKDGFWLAGPGVIDMFEAIEEFIGAIERENAGTTLGHDDAVLVNGVTGVGQGDDIAGTDNGEHKVGQTFLGADGGDGFGFRIEFDAPFAFVALGDGKAEVGNAAGDGVAMIAGIAGGLNEFVDDDTGSRSVGIAHAEVDHILLGCAEFCLHFVDDGKNVRGQLGDAVKLFVR